MNLVKYSLIAVNVLLGVHMVILFLLKNIVFNGGDLPILLSYFTYAFLGFWIGMLFMNFLFGRIRKRTNSRNNPEQTGYSLSKN